MSARSAWTSVGAKAKTLSLKSGRPPQQIVREFAYDRLLARMFAENDRQWVLKGGTALMRRVDDARYSMDIDLLCKGASMQEAVEELRVCLERDVGDPFTFQVVSVSVQGGPGQPDVEGARVGV